MRSGDFARLRSYGIGVEADRFVRLDLATFEPLRPVQLATEAELIRIARQLRQMNTELAYAIAARLDADTSRDHSYYANELQRHPEALGRLSAKELDAATLRSVKETLEKAKAGGAGGGAWQWLFDASGAHGEISDAAVSSDGGRPARRALYQLPLADRYLAAADNAALRREGVRLLGLSGFSDVSKLSRAASDDPAPAVRMDAVDQLGRLGGPAVFNALAGMYRKEADAEVKGKILYALSRGRDPGAVELVLETIRADDPLSRSLHGEALSVLNANFSTSFPASSAGALSLFGLRQASDETGG